MATIAVSGSNGFVGAALVSALRARGDQVRPLLRPTASGGFGAHDPASVVRWDPARGELDSGALEGVDGVVHLAGESLANGRWTDAQKQRIEQSRTRGTRLLAEGLAGLTRKPQVLLSASAIGYYGDRGVAELDESAERGDDFLARLCAAWEEAAAPARAAGLRVAHPRFGVVLHPSGGALAKMLPLFRWGMGGALGDGAQFMSWIALADVVRALLFTLDQSALEGPVNFTAPTPVTNAELTRSLARALARPGFMQVPRFALRAVLGEMADAALLASAKVLPRKLLELGFSFEEPELEPYLRSVLR
jgi:uncharacterized protein (TIGR01777 family)